MKALRYTHYGDPTQVLSIVETNEPHPKDIELLIRVVATTVNRTDYATVKGIPFFARLITGVFGPKRPIPGTEFSGEVLSVGERVTQFKPGDRVFGFSDSGTNAHAQYLTSPEEFVRLIPDGISFSHAVAGLEGVHYAYNFINKVTIEAGQRVLVIGAVGGIGSAALQLLVHFGVLVTAVCSAEKKEAALSLGAIDVIDYTAEDFTQCGRRFDFVFDTAGKSSFFQCYGLLKPGGVYLSSELGDWSQNLFLPTVTFVIKPLLQSKKTVFPVPVKLQESLDLIHQLMACSKFKAVIGAEYPFEQIVEAYQYVGQGHKSGSVVIRV
ncbi:MAG: NAD(P)-dependent alcohol dehydrogenase [Gammaproteobacteria bacterium]|nr:NAD(P)-dependent alcohol dehydrogenase [Gammaproteobacteria bacterium]MDH5800140.1 NAD(P)-dependent alcohol dehydrogenase [Gammaproteobacteria bacterium]